MFIAMEQAIEIEEDVIDAHDIADCNAENNSICINTLAFHDGAELKSWTFCSHKVSRSLAVFASQVLVASFLIAFSCINLFIADTCEDKSIYIALLSTAVGYFLPNPKL